VRGGRDDTGQRRADGQHDLEAEPAECQPGGELTARKQAGNKCAAGRAVDGYQRRLDRDERVEQPEQVQPGERLGGESRRYRGQAAAGHQHQLPPVHRVGDRAAE